MKLVAYSGYATSGKDSAVAALVEFKKFTRISFADKLREFVYAMNPVIWDDDGDSSKYLQEIIDDFGWDGYKESGWGMAVREFLQSTGQAARETFGENFWVDQVFANLDPDGKYAISDMRYKSEAAAVVAHGGITVRIARPGVVAANDHISENDLNDYPFDHCVVNDQSLPAFKLKIAERFGV